MRSMASSKEIQQSSRPASMQRLSVSNSVLGSSLPKSHGRNHSHSISSGSLNPSHRVTRRKSNAGAAGANIAGIAAALREGPYGIPVTTSSRKTPMVRSVSTRSGSNYPSPPNSLPYHAKLNGTRKSEKHDSAIDDELNEEEDEEESSFSKARTRRASEGQHLVKGDKKGAPGDLRCDKCGKGYKHSSCLTKHLWEHTPEWSLTSKLLISKHQQVQLLEAASVLVGMNQAAEEIQDPAQGCLSDAESASPSIDGSSGDRRQSSADTTPPPQAEGQTYAGSAYGGQSKRYSNGSNISRSYQSAVSYAGSVPNGSGFGHYRPQSTDPRPVSSGIGGGGQEDEAGLAAAVELLSCSFGTPKHGPTTLPPDVPPVPPLPAQYIGQNSFSAAGLAASLTPTHLPGPVQHAESYTRHHAHHGSMDVKMDEVGAVSVADDDDFDSRSRARSDEDDEGVFGRMEE